MTTKRLLLLAGTATAAVLLPATAALAAPGSPSPAASCVGSITAYETQYNPFTGEATHGFVGPWLSGNATSGPGTIADFNRGAAQLHGSIDDCVG